MLTQDDLADLRTDIVALRRELRSLPGLGEGEASLGAVLQTIAARLERLPDEPPATTAELEAQIERIAQLLEDPTHSRLALAHIEASLKAIEERLDETRRSMLYRAADPDGEAGESAIGERRRPGARALRRRDGAEERDAGVGAEDQGRARRRAGHARGRRQAHGVPRARRRAAAAAAAPVAPPPLAEPARPGRAGPPPGRLRALSPRTRAPAAPARIRIRQSFQPLHVEPAAEAGDRRPRRIPSRPTSTTATTPTCRSSRAPMRR